MQAESAAIRGRHQRRSPEHSGIAPSQLPILPNLRACRGSKLGRRGPVRVEAAIRSSLSRRTGILCIFTRPTTPGLTKTRLIPAYGAANAARLAEAFLLDTYELVSGLKLGSVVVSVAADGPLPRLEPPASIWRQGPGDLGDRMTRVAARALAQDYPWVVLLGSDSPGMPAALLVEAVQALDRGSSAVIGPALDGGYYLLGLADCPPRLLAGLSWSGSDTRTQTIERLEAHGLRPYLLPEWFDIDVPADLARLALLLDENEARAPHTRRVLDSLKHHRAHQHHRTHSE